MTALACCFGYREGRKKSGGVAMFRGQDLNDTTIEGFGLGSKFDCVFHPESLAPLGWDGRRKKQAVG